LDELASGVKKKRVQHIDKLQSYINTLASGDDKQTGHWKCPIKIWDEVDTASFTDGQAKKVEEKVDGIIRKALAFEESWASDWTNVCKRLAWILTTLRQREDLTDSKIAVVCLIIDEWSDKWIDLVSNEGMTNDNFLL
jgi:hypothetical protein